MAAEYWLEIQLEEGPLGRGPFTLPLAWFAYSYQAESFAQSIIKLPGVKGIGKGPEGKPHTKKWGRYEPTELGNCYEQRPS